MNKKKFWIETVGAVQVCTYVSVQVLRSLFIFSLKKQIAGPFFHAYYLFFVSIFISLLRFQATVIMRTSFFVCFRNATTYLLCIVLHKLPLVILNHWELQNIQVQVTQFCLQMQDLFLFGKPRVENPPKYFFSRFICTFVSSDYNLIHFNPFFLKIPS